MTRRRPPRRAVERGVVDLVEAASSSGREGERFDAVVIDDGLVQLREPAVRGRLEDGGPPPGRAVSVRLRTGRRRRPDGRVRGR